MLLLVDDHSMSFAIKKLKILKVSIPATLFFIYYVFIYLNCHNQSNLKIE